MKQSQESCRTTAVAAATLVVEAHVSRYCEVLQELSIAHCVRGWMTKRTTSLSNTSSAAIPSIYLIVGADIIEALDVSCT